MSRRIITLPLPSRHLSPNARVHWATKARATKAYRERAMLEALSKRPPDPWTRAKVQAIFYWPDKRRRDRDNALACMKSAFDGIADGRIVENDAGLTYLPVVFEVCKHNPRVELVIDKEAGR